MNYVDVIDSLEDQHIPFPFPDIDDGIFAFGNKSHNAYTLSWFIDRPNRYDRCNSTNIETRVYTKAQGEKILNALYQNLIKAKKKRIKQLMKNLENAEKEYKELLRIKRRKNT